MRRSGAPGSCSSRAAGEVDTGPWVGLRLRPVSQLIGRRFDSQTIVADGLFRIANRRHKPQLDPPAAQPLLCLLPGPKLLLESVRIEDPLLFLVAVGHARSATSRGPW
jgi:hypothetical protein